MGHRWDLLAVILLGIVSVLTVDRTPLRYVPFRCRSGTVSVSITFRCDGFAHCPDRSDEEGCVAASLLEGPPAAVSVRVGEWMNLTCRGTGVPAPTVRWRMNGNELLDPVCDWVTELDGTGKLSCRMRLIDAGNYSCHLFHPLGQVDVRPVTVVSVRGNPCPEGEFMAGDGSGRRCMKCFCSGVSRLCQKADIYRWNYTMTMNDWKMGFATWDGQGVVETIKHLGKFASNRSLYYSLPYRFIEYQVKSYGGYLQVPRQSDHIPEIVLMGYNRTLVYRSKASDQLSNGTVKIQLQESNFMLQNGTAIDRVEFLTVLAYIDRFLIRIHPTNGRYEPSAQSIVMDSASDYQRGIGKADFVEVCRCPAGFRSTSCERCDFGYNRAFVGPPMGLCMPWEWHRKRYVPTSTTPRTYHYVKRRTSDQEGNELLKTYL